tara:strand:- start:2893 stop:3330 length:438 start_codon:yes stop_codon:yes gene_type:complete
MDIYDISFILSTFWVGPFWFAMLINPNKEKTKTLMNKPWFFLGPLAIWYILMIINPQGLIDFATSTSNPNGFLEGLAAGLATKAGVSATWAHMVAGDIFVTRWIWKDSIEKNTNTWISRISIFFGVMLMPIGLALHMGLRNVKNK